MTQGGAGPRFARPRRWFGERRVQQAVFVLCAGSLLLVVVVAVPGWLVDHDLGGGRVEAKDRLGAVNSTRATLLQAVGGLVLLYGGYVGWRQLRVSQDTLRATQDGHLSERFGRAVEQLGSDRQGVRIGGLHALRRIGEQAPDERDAVISIHAAYLRGRLRWPPTGPDAPPADTPLRAVGTLEARADAVRGRDPRERRAAGVTPAGPVNSFGAGPSPRRRALPRP